MDVPQVSLTTSALPATRDTLVFCVFEDEVEEGLSVLRDIEDIRDVLKADSFTGKQHQYRFLYPKTLGCARLLLVGLGSKASCTQETFRRAIGHATRLVNTRHREEMVVCATVVESVIPTRDVVRAATEAIILGSFRVDTEKKEPKPVHIHRALLVVSSIDEYKDEVSLGSIASTHTRHVRKLVNTSPSVATPDYLARYARDVAPLGVSVDVWDEHKLAEANMGGMLAVGRGSVSPPRFVILEYKPKSIKKSVALVGKGITFDSGGLSLKPSVSMETMKCDKAGACAVLETVCAAAQLHVPVHVYGICAFAENMPDGDAYKLGDVVKTASGKTVEVLNTDAEGRIVLADALHYATTLGVDHIIDMATLTGACQRALGNSIAGVLGSNQELIDALVSAGTYTGEKVWQLPLEKDYEKILESRFADIKNVAGNGRSGPGAITAAWFLKAFVGDASWAHIDIAGTAWVNEDNARAYLTPGGSGFGVRLLLEFLRRLE